MRRLQRQLYLAIVGTLLAFVVAVAMMWHFVATPMTAVWSVESNAQLSAAMLNGAPATPEAARAIMDALMQRVYADVVLLAPDGKTVIAAGGRPFDFTAAQRREPGWHLHDGPALNMHLDDGRTLLLHPRQRFLMHGLHMVLLLTFIAAVLALLTYPITRGLTARLERLELGVQKFGAGDLGARVAVEGRDEVASLAQRFNESAARVEQLVKSSQMLLANCSHELRTPLTRMRLAIERGAGADAQTGAELTRGIAELDALIGELLLTTRLEAVKQLQRVEHVDLLALTAEEAAHFEREASGDAVTVDGDPLLLRRLVRNLLENARLHAGGATLVHVEAADAGARLVVEDAGPGVAAEDREKIFEPFFRRTGSAPASGTGLGLSIVRQIARLHGGEVQYAARAGGGSRFVVRLPARRSP